MPGTITYDVKVVRSGAANVRKTTTVDGVKSYFRYIIEATDTAMTGQPQEVVTEVNAQRAALAH